MRRYGVGNISLSLSLDTVVKGDGSGAGLAFGLVGVLWAWANGWVNLGRSQPTRRPGPNKPVCDAYTGGVAPCPERGNVCEWRQLIMSSANARSCWCPGFGWVFPDHLIDHLSCLRGGEHTVLRRMHPPPYAARNHASGAHRSGARTHQDRSIQGAEVTTPGAQISRQGAYLEYNLARS